MYGFCFRRWYPWISQIAVNGGWSAWKDFTAWTNQCGEQTRDGVRTCTSPSPNGCGAGCTILPSHENAAEQIKFQRLYPAPIETSYDPDAFHDDLNPLAGDYHQDLAQKGEDRFLWVMWRKYQGCVQAGCSLIKEIRW